MNTYANKTQGNKSQLVASDSITPPQGTVSTVQLEDNRPEALAQRKLLDTLNDSLSQKTVQLKVDKYRNGAWFSTFDPYTIFPTKKLATDYDRNLKSQGRDQLRARVPTIYTYTHTKPANKLSYTSQGPHTVAHRVILQALIDASNVVEVFKIFDEQVLEPKDVEEVVFTDEAPASGSFTKQIQDRLERFVEDYENIYDEVLPMFTSPNPDLIKIKHLTNMLLNMDPYAVYAWKTTTKASSKSLGGKGESVSNPTWGDLYDTPPSNSFRNQPNLSSFVSSRQDLFNHHF